MVVPTLAALAAVESPARESWWCNEGAGLGLLAVLEAAQ